MIGIIGGSGLYNIEGIALKERKKVSTPFGEPSGPYEIGEFSGVDIIFLPRHGSGHTIPPHRINYRANIWGFKQIGVERIMSVSASGGLRLRMKPGTITVLDQIIDMTSGREGTFFDGVNGVAHIDFTEPFCPELRKATHQCRREIGDTDKKIRHLCLCERTEAGDKGRDSVVCRLRGRCRRDDGDARGRPCPGSGDLLRRHRDRHELCCRDSG